LSPLTLVAAVAGAILVVGWLIVSFTTPSPKREVIEWLSACAMYALLTSLFTHLILRSQEEGNTFALVAFGFLGVLFGAGLLVTLFRALTAMRGSGGSGSSATN
jgi:hypothetical protein